MRKSYFILPAVFIGLFLTFASGEKIQDIAIDVGKSIETQRYKETDEMLQFSAGGHVLGFRKGEMFIASADHALRIEFVNALAVSPREKEMSQNTEDSSRAAKPLGKVSYRNLWDGVTLVYEKHNSGVVKSTYYIQPVGDSAVNLVDQIRLRYNVPVKVEESGSLLFCFETGQMRETRPVAWQEIKGKRVPVEVSFCSLSEQGVGIKASSYDSRFPLIIDPVLSWNTFMGSASSDVGNSIAVDTGGNFYVAGYSDATWGTPVNAYAGGSYDAFVAKLDTDGNRLWNTFMGSASYDFGNSIAVDTGGNVYVAGDSYSSWGEPVNDHTVLYDAFAAKLDTDGNRLWNTFMGSANYNDYGNSIAVDTGGNVYVAGESGWTWGIDPVNAHTGENSDIFATKLDTDGSRLWNTFMGSANYDVGNSIAVDTSGNVYVAGYSYATWGDPVNAFAGGRDAFAAKLDTDGSRLWNTFMGSASSDVGNSIAVDTGGNVYVAGNSYATWGDPVNAHAGGRDAFAAKLDTDGSRLWNTFMGLGDYDEGNSIAVDTGGNVYVAGAKDRMPPAPIGARSFIKWISPSSATLGQAEIANGIGDAFAIKLDNDGTQQWDTTIGSTGSDDGNSIAVDTSGNVYVAGYSYATWGEPVNAYSGSSDAFVVKLGEPEINIKYDATDIPDGGSYDFELRNVGTDTEETFTIENTGDTDLTLTTPITIGGADSGEFSVQSQPTSPVQLGGSTTLILRYSPTSAGAKTASLSIVNNDSDENPYDISLSGDAQVVYILTIGAGTGGTTNPSPGIHSYIESTQVNVTATADTGYIFNGWTGDVPTGHENDNPVAITMDSDKSVTANFTRQYTLTIASGTGGTTDPVPGAHTYDTGTQVNITATADNGYIFAGWTGDVPAGHENDNPVAITMDSDKSVTANFTLQYTLTIASGTGGATNPAPGAHTYDTGTQVNVTATADNGYIFNGWTGDVPAGHEDDNPVAITVDSDKSVTANFVRQYTLTIASGTGGATNPAPGAHTYDTGTQVNVTATADNGYIFAGWTGNVPAGHENDNPVAVTMDSDKSVTANFVRQYTLTISSGPGGTTNPSPGSYIYNAGTRVTISCTAEANSRFSHWSGDVAGTTEPLTIMMDSDKSITANFIRIIYPPSNFSGRSVVNRSLFLSEYLNTLTWQANPNNENIVGYRVYLVEGVVRNLLADVNASTFEYWHRSVEGDKQYTYVLVAVNSEGREGDPASISVQ